MALMTDMRAAIRALIAARAFTLIAVLTLAAALALTAAIVTVMNAYAWRSLPYPAADRLYRVDYAAPGQSGPRDMDQLEWSTLDDVVELPIAWDLDVFYLLGRDYPESAPGAWVTPGYIDGLGVRAAHGRTIALSDYRPDSPPVALISHRLWQSRFAGDQHIVGTTFAAYVSDRPDEPEAFTIIGVLPEDFWPLNIYSEVLAPLKARSYPYQLRLRAGVAPAVVEQRIDRLIRSASSVLPPHYGVRLTSLQDSYVAQLKPVLWAVLTGAALVLLIACANVTVLMIVRVRQREREFAVRMALGASQWRVARLIALEGVLIGLSATVLGSVLSAAVMPGVAPLVERAVARRVPRGLDALAFDADVALVVLAAGLMTTFVFTFIPLLLARQSRDVVVASSARGLGENARAGRARAVLIGVELAASLTLLVGASLMAESALRMLRVDFGIAPESVVTAGLALRQRTFPELATQAAFYERLEAELEGIAGSSVVALGDWWPLQGSRPRPVEAAGRAVATATPFAVSARYFDAVGIRLLEGRAFTPEDRLGAEPVVIVSASLASRVWPLSSPLGQRLTIHPDGDEPPEHATVVGVVNDVRQMHVDADLLDAYRPLAQHPTRFAFVYFRDARRAPWERELRAAIARVHPEVALSAPRPLADGLEQERARPRVLAYLLAAFAVFACVLALVGIHGVIAYAVRQRQREIAVRVAVGATARAVTLMFLRYGSMVLAAGLGLGVVGAVALGRILQTQLHGVGAAEPRVLALATLVLGGFALVAVVVPARRAAATDPAIVLKHE